MSLDDFQEKVEEECYDVKRGRDCQNKATWAYLYAEPDIEQDVPGLTLYFCDICKAKWEKDEFKDSDHWSKLGGPCVC